MFLVSEPLLLSSRNLLLPYDISLDGHCSGFQDFHYEHLLTTNCLASKQHRNMFLIVKPSFLGSRNPFLLQPLDNNHIILFNEIQYGCGGILYRCIFSCGLHEYFATVK